MQPKYFALFTFVYISKKNTPFRGIKSPTPFLDIYFCPKRKTPRTFGNSFFCVLYILLIFLLKETYIPSFFKLFYNLCPFTHLSSIHKPTITSHECNHIYSLFKEYQIIIIIVNSPCRFVNTYYIA